MAGSHNCVGFRYDGLLTLGLCRLLTMKDFSPKRRIAMNAPDAAPLVKELVLVGGGHTHALVLRKWGMRPVPGARLTLINPGPVAPYSGMLPGFIAGHYSRDALEIDLVRLARFAGARLILDHATAVDPAAGLVHLAGRGSVAYDLLSVDIGVTSDMAQLPGFADHAVAAKPLAGLADRWDSFCQQAGPAKVAIIGGGVAGAEIAMAVAHRLATLGRPAHISVIDRGKVLSGATPSARRKLLAAMDALGISRVQGAAPVAVLPDAVELEGGRMVPADLTIGAAGAVPQAWLADSGLPCVDGYLAVDAQLRSLGDPRIYAAGDCAHLTHAPRPKAGVFAVRAAPVLAWNLRADLVGLQRRSFHPQRDFLKLVSLGGKVALAEKLGVAVTGAGLWGWKDRIDRDFMDQFGHLPVMSTPPAPKGAARGVAAELAGPAPCGGCGAKLGQGALSDALARLPDSQRDDVMTGPGDDAAVIRVGGALQVLTTDHLRAFALDPALVARVTATHALGDIWAMGATPQTVMANVVLPRMAARLQSGWLTEIMDAAAEVFGTQGAQIVGGHSSMGAELTVGFSITGLLDGQALTIAGAQPGDALILTRGIGTGVILAAEMRGQADGRDVANAWAQMQTPQGDAAQVLRSKARAMTDVTGFGLAGHVSAICRASGVGAQLHLADIPVLPGAASLAARGIRSTLFAQNQASLANNITIISKPSADLVFDPQTAGGLLAAVPADDADRLVAALQELGHPAAVIGKVLAGPPRITLV